MAKSWFGPVTAFEPFHWHGETFSIPLGGTRILGNAHCANQAFALGKHLGMQCHVEMTEDMVRAWCKGGADEIEEAKSSPGVQSPQKIEKNLQERIGALHKIADRLYDKWCENVSKG